MKSLISVVIVLVVGSAFAQTNTNTVPQTAPAATPAPTPAPAKAKANAAAKKAATTPAAATAAPAVAAPSTPAAPAAAAPATPTTPATSQAAPVNPDAAPMTAPAADATGDIATDDEATAATVDYRLPQGLLTNLGITYYSRDISDSISPNTGKVDLLSTELKVGWVFDFGLFAGATIHYDTGKFSGNSVTTQYAGPTIGWSENNSGILATATYHVVGTMDMDSLGKYDQVTGLQIDISYPMSISEKLKFGPQLTWRNMKQEDGDNGLIDESSQELVPFMGVWYVF